ncbi:MAG: hypothetical protein GY714_11145 [Desulfobacterales bacterium]|nr:hypothetical protein [Desulfobacterales bacterium]
MTNNVLKWPYLMLISGILNCILGIVHQVVLYVNYGKYAKLITSETEHILSDATLFSMGIGTTLLFIGLLSCYCYTGIKKRERWAFTVGLGVSCLLILFALKIIAVVGGNHPIAYVHLFTSFLNGFPLITNRGVLSCSQVPA